MAILGELNEPGWSDWVASRPESIRKLAERLPPNRLYRMGSTGHRCTIAAYCEDGTVRVDVTGQFNFVAFSRSVFGVDPASLKECDLPGAEEPVGDAGWEPEVVFAIAGMTSRNNG